MSQYSTGTVSTVIGTNVVTGVGTSWIAFVSAGDEIKIGTDKFFYIVAAVAIHFIVAGPSGHVIIACTTMNFVATLLQRRIRVQCPQRDR